MATTPSYNPADLNPPAALDGHTHAHTHAQRLVIGVGAYPGALVANPPDRLKLRNWWGVTVTITELHYELGSAPAGSGVTIELRRNGTAVHTATINAGSTKVDYTGLSIAWAAETETLEMVPTAVGSSTPGSTLVGSAVGTVAGSG